MLNRILIFVLLTLQAGLLYAQSSTTASASVCTSVSGTGSLVWSSPENAAAGAGYATATGTGVTQYLQCSGFDFSTVPATAVITGITLNVTGKSNTGAAMDAHVHVGKSSDSFLAADGATHSTYSTSGATLFYGGPTSLWGVSWAPSDLNNLNTYFSASLTSGIMFVDTVTATVTYWAPPVLTAQSSSGSGPINGFVGFPITVKNTNSVALTNVVVTTALPSGLAYKSSALTPPDFSTVSSSGQSVTWSIPSLDPGATFTMNLINQLTSKGLQTLVVNGTGQAPGGILLNAKQVDASVVVLAQAMTHYQMDEPIGSWKGADNEVVDSGGTQVHATRLKTGGAPAPSPVLPDPTIESTREKTKTPVISSFCNAGKFDGNSVVKTAVTNIFHYEDKFSASVWIYPTSYPASDLMAILSNDVNYEFHLDPSGHLYWWWQASTLTSKSVIPLNTWTHVAITFDSSSEGGRQHIYINGVLDDNTNSWKGTLKTNNCAFYIGGDVYTDGNCTPATGRNFRGMIDEAKLYNYELSTSEVNADMTLGRLCSGVFDHVQLEIAGDATVCAPATVVVKACLDSNCKTLYPGDVVVTLSPASTSSVSWMDAETFTLKNGIAVKQLSSTTKGDVTIGINNTTTPNPGSGLQCFKGGVASNCKVNFADASCAFDLVEVGAAPRTRIYTKLVGQPFTLDLLVLNGQGQVDTKAQKKKVQVDVVNTSSDPCPSSPESVVASGGLVDVSPRDNGRKTITFTSSNAAKVVSGRALIGGTPSCSFDKFAIRPVALTVSSSDATADGTGADYASAIPKIKAGASFNLMAQAGSGYNGTPKLNVNASVTAYRPPFTPASNGSLIGTFNSGSGDADGIASGSAFKYSEVGYFTLPLNFVYDDTFAIVDSGVGDCVNEPTQADPKADFSNVLNGDKKYGCKFGNSNTPTFGRFIPDHFVVTGGTLTSQRAPASTFSYIGEPMTGTFTLTAQNASNTTTQNYSGAYAKLAVALPAAFNFVVDNGAKADGTSINIANTLTSQCAGNSCASWIKGVAATTASFVLGRDAVNVGPYENLRLGIAPVDDEGVAMNTLDMDVTALPAGNDHTKVATTKARLGVVRLGNAYGSEVLPLRVPVEVQYWNGTLFQTNYDDSSTTFSSGNFLMSNCLRGIATDNACAGNHTALSPANITLVNGRANLILSAPGRGNAGSLDLCLDLGADTHAPTYTCSATSAGMSYLQGAWGGATNDYDPKSRATFGIYKRNNEMIYLRENY